MRSLLLMRLKISLMNYWHRSFYRNSGAITLELEKVTFTEKINEKILQNNLKAKIRDLSLSNFFSSLNKCSPIGINCLIIRRNKSLTEYKSHNARITKLNYGTCVNEKKYAVHLQINLFLYLLRCFSQRLD